MRDPSEIRPASAEMHTPFRDTLPHTGPDRSTIPRILCVDDDPYLLQGLCRVLGLDFEVVTEGDALAALKRLESESDFQVVLSDLKMPGLDGTRFLAETRRIIPAASRLLLTGVPDLDAAIAAINQGGVFRFLTKPCRSDQLLETVHAAVKQHRLSLAQLEPEALQSAGSVPWQQRPLPRRGELPEDLGTEVFGVLDGPPSRVGELPGDGSAAASQTRRAFVRPGSHLALLARLTQAALDDGRAKDAERVLEAPLRALLSNAQAARPTDPDDNEMAAILAARLGAATGDGTWIEYVFLLFCAVRRLLSSHAIDEVQKALHRVRRVNPGPLELYLSVLEFHGRAHTSTERCLLKRIQQCRALLPAAG